MSRRVPSERTVRVEVKFHDRGAAVSCLQRVQRVPGVLFNILRGRVTPDEVFYELELTGQEPEVERVVWSLAAAASA
jgi:hypothetical protein